MGDRYFLTIMCPKCGNVEEDVYFAPTCDFTSWKCENCGKVIDLCKHTGITEADTSNADEIGKLINSFQKEGVIKAPWTEVQIRRLQSRQEDLTKHPYTCGVCSESLTPYCDGWHCDYCHQFKQDWAHSIDANGDDDFSDITMERW